MTIPSAHIGGSLWIPFLLVHSSRLLTCLLNSGLELGRDCPLRASHALTEGLIKRSHIIQESTGDSMRFYKPFRMQRLQTAAETYCPCRWPSVGYYQIACSLWQGIPQRLKSLFNNALKANQNQNHWLPARGLSDCSIGWSPEWWSSWRTASDVTVRMEPSRVPPFSWITIRYISYPWRTKSHTMSAVFAALAFSKEIVALCSFSL